MLPKFAQFCLNFAKCWPNVAGIFAKFAEFQQNCASVPKIGFDTANILILWQQFHILILWRYFDTLALRKTKLKVQISLLESLQPGLRVDFANLSFPGAAQLVAAQILASQKENLARLGYSARVQPCHKCHQFYIGDRDTATKDVPWHSHSDPQF